MGKMKFLVLASALMLAVPTIAGAIQTNTIDVAAGINQDTAVQVREAGSAAAIDAVTNLANRYMTNLRTCEPVHLSQSLDLFGFKFSYQFDINGWVDNKCSYYMTGNIGALGNDIRDEFKIQASDEMIAKIKPVIKCNFDQEQLDILIDGFEAAQTRKVSEKVGLVEKASTGKPKMSIEEEKMMQMLMSGQVCTVPNQEELMKNFTELMATFKSTTPSLNDSEQVTPEVSVPSVPVEEVPANTYVEPEQERIEMPQLRQDGPKVNMPSAPRF